MPRHLNPELKYEAAIASTSYRPFSRTSRTHVGCTGSRNTQGPAAGKQAPPVQQDGGAPPSQRKCDRRASRATQDAPARTAPSVRPAQASGSTAAPPSSASLAESGTPVNSVRFASAATAARCSRMNRARAQPSVPSVPLAAMIAALGSFDSAMVRPDARRRLGRPRVSRGKCSVLSPTRTSAPKQQVQHFAPRLSSHTRLRCRIASVPRPVCRKNRCVQGK